MKDIQKIKKRLDRSPDHSVGIVKEKGKVIRLDYGPPYTCKWDWISHEDFKSLEKVYETKWLKFWPNADYET